MTKMPVSTSAKVGDWNTSVNAWWYMMVGSSACAGCTPWRTSHTARNEPTSSLNPPSSTQPGPVPSTAVHQPTRFCLVLLGRKRR